jgi:hypothetical protein
MPACRRRVRPYWVIERSSAIFPAETTHISCNIHRSV